VLAAPDRVADLTPQDDLAVPLNDAVQLHAADSLECLSQRGQVGLAIAHGGQCHHRVAGEEQLLLLEQHND